MGTVRTLMRDTVTRLARWPWQEGWRGVVLPPGGEARCPEQGPVSMEVCRACPKYVETRSVRDAGGLVTMVICRE